MNTSNLSQTGPLTAVPSFPPMRSLVGELAYHARALLVQAFRPEGSAFSTPTGAGRAHIGTPSPLPPFRNTSNYLYSSSSRSN
jgi:hypothetical protein